jgi:hypothetical protein
MEQTVRFLGTEEVRLRLGRVEVRANRMENQRVCSARNDGLALCVLLATL